MIIVRRKPEYIFIEVLHVVVIYKYNIDRAISLKLNEMKGNRGKKKNPLKCNSFLTTVLYYKSGINVIISCRTRKLSWTLFPPYLWLLVNSSKDSKVLLSNEKNKKERE